jgi:hypothetical protein
MVVNDSCTAPCRLSGKPVESIRGARRRRELHAHFDASNGRRAAMIKDVMVPVDGTAADEERLAAASQIAEVFNSQIIGLFLNVLPVMIVQKTASAHLKQRNCCRKRGKLPTGWNRA